MVVKQTSLRKECCEDMENWRFHGSVIDGEELRIVGLNIWEHSWKSCNESITVKAPIYGQSHLMSVYEISDGNIMVRFAAGEFSNLVWGIYLPA